MSTSAVILPMTSVLYKTLNCVTLKISLDREVDCNPRIAEQFLVAVNLPVTQACWVENSVGIQYSPRLLYNIDKRECRGTLFPAHIKMLLLLKKSVPLH